MRAIQALLVLVLLTAWAGGLGPFLGRTRRGRRRLVAAGVGGFVLILRSIRRGTPRWRVGVHSRKDGTMLVQLERAGERSVTFRELPPAMDQIDFAANLRVAVEEAEAQANELNRR